MMISTRSDTRFNVGIDVGKQQLDVLWHETGEHQVVGNDAQGIRSLIKCLRKQSLARIVIEATGRYERAFVMAC